MTVKELRDVLKNFDDDLTVITKKTDFFEGNVGFVNNVRKSSFSFMFVDMLCVLLTDEPQEESTESENVWNIGDRVRFKTSGGWYNSGIIRDMDEDSFYLIEVDKLGYEPDDVHMPLPYYIRLFACDMIKEEE